MVRKLPAYMTEILLGKGVKWNKQTKQGILNSKYRLKSLPHFTYNASSYNQNAWNCCFYCEIYVIGLRLRLWLTSSKTSRMIVHLIYNLFWGQGILRSPFCWSATDYWERLDWKKYLLPMQIMTFFTPTGPSNVHFFGLRLILGH
jgi:hypothetical protein